MQTSTRRALTFAIGVIIGLVFLYWFVNLCYHTYRKSVTSAHAYYESTQTNYYPPEE